MAMRPSAISTAVAAGLAATLGCGPTQLAPGIDAGVVAIDAPTSDGPADDTGEGDGGLKLLGAPLIFAPTAHGFGLSVVLRSGDSTSLRARVRDEAVATWSDIVAPTAPAADIAQWSVTGLAPGRRYAYQICAA